jgi:LuxR family maltose regulon positive regulatory protein
MLNPPPPELFDVGGGSGVARPEAGAVRTRAPVVPRAVLRRDRLTAQLTAAVGGRFTVVSAGPGWGKTLTVAAWAASGAIAGPVAWLSLEESDNDPRTFFARLVAAVIGSGGVRVGSPLLNPGWVGPVDVADMDELWGAAC